MNYIGAREILDLGEEYNSVLKELYETQEENKKLKAEIEKLKQKPNWMED